MAKLAANEAQITNWLASQQDAMLALLRDAVNTDSSSYDKPGVDKVGQIFIDFFTQHGLLTQREPSDTYGDAIHIRLDDTRSNEKPILLMGHRDTVFPKGEAGRRPFRIEDGRAYGPGVCDMKGGLVINAFVLAAFKRFGGVPAPLAGLITSDEEIASPSSNASRGRCAASSTQSRDGRPAPSSQGARVACS
jgi:glutamate carboxypeptidase